MVHKFIFIMLHIFIRKQCTGIINNRAVNNCNFLMVFLLLGLHPIRGLAFISFASKTLLVCIQVLFLSFVVGVGLGVTVVSILTDNLALLKFDALCVSFTNMSSSDLDFSEKNKIAH